MARQNDERWTTKSLHWRRQRETKMSKRELHKRWVDDIRKNWTPKAKDRLRWKEMGEAYIQESVAEG